MAGYIIRAIEVYRLPVYSNVIYLRPDAGNKPEYLGSLVVLGNLVYDALNDAQTILEIISEETMQQSSIAEYLAPEAHEQGIQQGAQETIRENILEALAFQLQPEIAETFKSDLETINDLQRLKQLFRTAIRAETPEDFIQALNENGE